MSIFPTPSVLPAQGELLFVLVDMPRQGHEVDVDLLQIEGSADLLFDRGALDREAAGCVDLDQRGEYTAEACGLSARIASTIGRDSSLA